MNILIITCMISPARCNYYNELGKLCNLTVIAEREFLSDRGHNFKLELTKYYNKIELKGLKIGSYMAFSPFIIKYLKENNFDVIVIEQYASPTSILAIEYLYRNKIPFFINADGGFIKKENILKYKIKKSYISKATRWLTTGEFSKKYLIHYGAKQNDIYIYPFSSYTLEDIIHNSLMISNKLILKNKLKIKEDKLIISVGQFIPRKGFDVLLKSCKYLKNENIGIYIIGGVITDEYNKIINDLNLNNVYFIDFLSKEELKEYYCAADIAVFPTREDVWGFVVNEAMSFGLPVITTSRCGAGLELIGDFENGFVVPTEDHKAIADKINLLLLDDKLMQSIISNNINKIRYYCSQNMAQKHYDIFQIALNKI